MKKANLETLTDALKHMDGMYFKELKWLFQQLNNEKYLKRAQGKLAELKNPLWKPPKRPLSGYQIFTREECKIPLSTIVPLRCAQMWASMSEAEKSPFNQKAAFVNEIFFDQAKEIDEVLFQKVLWMLPEYVYTEFVTKDD